MFISIDILMLLFISAYGQQTLKTCNISKRNVYWSLNNSTNKIIEIVPTCVFKLECPYILLFDRSFATVAIEPEIDLRMGKVISLLKIMSLHVQMIPHK